MATAWPAVIARLLVLMPTLPGWSQMGVFDGHPVTADPTLDYVTVGYTPADDHGGSFVQVRNGDGESTDESGDVRCHLACQAGDTDLSAVRARAFAYVEPLRKALHDDQTLGGTLSVNATLALAADVMQVQDSNGVALGLLLVIRYTTETP